MLGQSSNSAISFVVTMRVSGVSPLTLCLPSLFFAPGTRLRRCLSCRFAVRGRAFGPPYRGRCAAMFTNRGGGSAPPSSLRSPRRPPVRAAPSPIALRRVGSPPAKCVSKRWGLCSVSWIVCASQAERVFPSWCSLPWLIRLNFYKRCSPPSRLGREGRDGWPFLLAPRRASAAPPPLLTYPRA